MTAKLKSSLDVTGGHDIAWSYENMMAPTSLQKWSGIFAVEKLEDFAGGFSWRIGVSTLLQQLGGNLRGV